jgi:hypothetical protein
MKEINLKLNKEEIYNPFNEDELNPSLGEYIFNKINMNELKDKISFNIYLEDDLKDADQDHLTFLFKDYFEAKLTSELYLEKKEDLSLLLILLTGIILLSLYYFVKLNSIPVVSEILLITGWVFIWEWIYRQVFTRSMENYITKKYRLILRSDINYFIN